MRVGGRRTTSSLAAFLFRGRLLDSLPELVESAPGGSKWNEVEGQHQTGERRCFRASSNTRSTPRGAPASLPGRVRSLRLAAARGEGRRQVHLRSGHPPPLARLHRARAGVPRRQAGPDPHPAQSPRTRRAGRGNHLGGDGGTDRDLDATEMGGGPEGGAGAGNAAGPGPQVERASVTTRGNDDGGQGFAKWS